ncbi:hypothetical protein LZC95_23000 [Pendulispora brunnea]|uniref:Uncharacterized protein n=1 Tax=Pendulispora brunnea TaxID=2905690 RepID=A0ABZ2KMA0_9BACT
MIFRGIPLGAAIVGATLLVGAIGVAGVVVSACGTDPTGIETCRSIEEARCRAAAACGNIDLDVPPHNGDSDGDKVEGCILWYHDACLHGLMNNAPDNAAVETCIEAIKGGDCNIVAHPEQSPACSWIAPPDRRPDAGDAGDAGDAADAANARDATDAADANSGSNAADASDAADTGNDR